MTADGGGMAGTVPRPVEGDARIAQHRTAVADKAPGLETAVDKAPGPVARRDGAVVTVAPSTW